MPHMEQEIAYWMEHRTVTLTGSNGTKHKMFRYNCQEGGPRPESYFEDFEAS